MPTLLYGIKSTILTNGKIREELNILPLTRILSVAEPYHGIGLILSVFLPLYTGSEITFLSPSWADARVEKLFKILEHQDFALIQSSVVDKLVQYSYDNDSDVDLKDLQWLSVIYHSRICGHQFKNFQEVMVNHGLDGNKISPMITSLAVPILTLPSNAPVTYLDRRSLRNDKILFTGRGNFHFFCVHGLNCPRCVPLWRQGPI